MSSVGDHPLPQFDDEVPESQIWHFKAFRLKKVKNDNFYKKKQDRENDKIKVITWAFSG